MSETSRIYLDNAATTWPKPEEVYSAVDKYQRELGVAAGRGNYRMADQVSRKIQQLRQQVADFLRAESSDEIVFTHNCTDSLNIVLHGLLRSGDHVATTAAEHNSVLRPLAELQRHGVSHTIVPLDESGRVDVGRLEDAICKQTKLVVLTHASNVTGVVQPIAQVSEVAQRRGCLLLVDAAQTLGYLPINVRSPRIDLLAAPGHKGLLGPLGTGILYIASGIETRIASLRQGGTGTLSEQSVQPDEMPFKFESGNPNVLGLMGLAAGVRYVREQRLVEDRRVAELNRSFRRAISGLPGLRLFGEASEIGITSFCIDSLDPRELATLLDSAGDVQVRAGLHCSPKMHESLGTLESGGTVRASFGHFNSNEHVARTVELVKTLASAATF